MSWSVSGKTVVITGATSGIGLEAGVVLAGMGARVILIGRDRARTDSAVATVRARTDKAAASYLCDFSSQASIRTLASAILRDHARIDVLVNNAGGCSVTRTITADGLETTFATNHLGYFLLTTLLLDRIIESAPARIVSVASEAHRHGRIDFDDLNLERGYGIARAYNHSKLANVLFASELARRLAGTGVTSNTVHPGTVRTNIWTRIPQWAKPFIAVLWPLLRTVEAGAATIVQLVEDPAVEGTTGAYFCNGRPKTPAPLARDEALGRRLWEVSEKMVGGVTTRTSGPKP